jgi:hypothetical protein
MQGLEISIARRVNAACSRRGRVFSDRYHLVQLRTPGQVRRAVCYVLNNWRHHRLDRDHGARVALDPFSSAGCFDGWLEDLPRRQVRSDDVVLPVAAPRTWLLATGWRRAGTISAWTVP